MIPKFLDSKDQTNILTNHRLSKQCVVLINHKSNQPGPEIA